MTYSEAIQFLYGLRLFGAKFGLENTFQLAELGGNPQQKLRFIHVAGTNGKGSTCAMLESIYRTSGLRVGLFTSPHLVSFSERIQVNRRNIPERDVARLVAEMQDVLERGWGAEAGSTRAGVPTAHPTFFEVVTVMALRYFAEQKCDLVIWETGLGGRLDATNIVTPLASVITNIEYDHEKWLGADLRSIAAEKAGIIKRGVPVITGAEEPAALEVIRKVARNQNTPVTIVSRTQLRSGVLKSVNLPLLGEHQRVNAAVAVAAVRAIPRIPVSDSAIRTGLSTVRWPGRLQILDRPGQKILLDGAHNVAGAQALATAIQKYFPAKKPVMILGILSDKNWKGICRVLAPLATRILAVPVSSERAADPAELQSACQEANSLAESRLCSSLAEALSMTTDEPFLLITGSLYLVGEALELLQGASSSRNDERALNEWSVKS
jgi:dihydrofolate synthase/folylpolyglutamate synthase